MSKPNHPNPIVVVRIIWAALLMGEILFMVIAMAIGPNQREPDPDQIRLLFYVATAMAVSIIPIGLFIRALTFRKGRRNGSLTPEAYLAGNIILWATCEGTAFFSLVGLLMNRGHGPHLFIAIAAMAVQALTFPTGAPLRAKDTLQPNQRL